jgi:hypothetical protein
MARTSSLKRSLRGSTNFSFIRWGNPPTLWWLFMVAEGPLNETLSITSGYSVPWARYLALLISFAFLSERLSVFCRPRFPSPVSAWNCPPSLPESGRYDRHRLVRLLPIEFPPVGAGCAVQVKDLLKGLRVACRKRG